MPLGTGAKLLTHGKSCTLQNSENTALSTGWIPLISRVPFTQQSCFQGAAVKCIIKQSHQTHGFMTAEFPEANPLAKASSWYFQDTVCNQIQAGPTATPNHFNLTIFLLSAYSHLTLQVGSSSYKNSNFPPPVFYHYFTPQFRAMHKSSASPSTSSSFPLFPRLPFTSQRREKEAQNNLNRIISCASSFKAES